MKIYASLQDDLSEGFVWLKKPGLPARGVVKITSPETKKSIFCESLQFEGNFLHKYNQAPRHTITNQESSIVMSAWYRAGLGGLETQEEYPLEITGAHSCYGKIRACLDHPQLVARVAVWLALLSVALGAVGIVLGVISIWPKGTSS